MYYSQCGEDFFLNNNFFKNAKNFYYIELGALDGVLYSNTKFFEDQLNWTGILIEPHPSKFKLLQKNRPNNFLFNNLVSCETDMLNFKYFENHHAAISGVEKTLPTNHFEQYYDNPEWRHLQQSSILIKPMTLTEIIKSTNIKNFNLLSLDVEGHEYEVLCSWDFSIPIEIILIEILGLDTNKEELCRQILRKNDYIFACVYKHNEIYILKNNIK